MTFRLDTLKTDRERVVFNRTKLAVAHTAVNVFDGDNGCTATYTNEFLVHAKVTTKLELNIRFAIIVLF